MAKKDEGALEKALRTGQNIPSGEIFSPYMGAEFDPKEHLALQTAEDDEARKAAEAARKDEKAARRAGIVAADNAPARGNDGNTGGGTT